MKTCGPDCHPICDTCAYHRSAGRDLDRIPWCNWRGEAQDPFGSCEHFFCIVTERPPETT